MTSDLLTRNVARRRAGFGLVRRGTELAPGVPVPPPPPPIVAAPREATAVLTRNLARRRIAFGTTLEVRAGAVPPITRPVKSGGNTEYVDEVAIGYDLIRDIEVDADLDTIYAGHNALVDAFNAQPALWTDDAANSILSTTDVRHLALQPGSWLLLGGGFAGPAIAPGSGGSGLAFFAPQMQQTYLNGTEVARLSATGLALASAGVPQDAREALDLTGALVVGPALGAWPGTIQFAAGHFQGYDGTAWLNLDELPAPPLWTDNAGIVSLADPAQIVALGPGGPVSEVMRLGPGPCFTHVRASQSYLLLVNRNPQNVLDDPTRNGWSLTLATATDGTDYCNLNRFTPSNVPQEFWVALANGVFNVSALGGCRIGPNTGLPAKDRLEVTGGVVFGQSINATPVDGTLDYLASGNTFRGRINGAWVNIPGAAGGAQWTVSTLAPISTNIITPTDPTVWWLQATNPTDGTATQPGAVLISDYHNTAAGAGVGPTLYLKRARAASAVPGVSHVLGRISVSPHITTTTWAEASAMTWTSTEAISAANRGSDFVLSLCPTGLGAQTSTLTFSNAGNLTITGIDLRAKQTQIVQNAAGYLEISSNQNGIAGNDGAKPTWIERFDQTADRWQIWRKPLPVQTAVALMTLDGTGTLTLPAGSGNALQWGSKTAKGRLTAPTGSDVIELSLNRTVTNTQDDVLKPSWFAFFDLQADVLQVNRCAAGDTSNQRIALTLNGAGKLTVPGDAISYDAVVWGTRTAKAHAFASAAGDSIGLRHNVSGNSTYDDSTKPGWSIQTDLGNDKVSIYRTPPTTAAWVELLKLDGVGALTLPGPRVDVGASVNSRGHISVPAGGENGVYFTSNSYHNGTAWVQDNPAVVGLRIAFYGDNLLFQRCPAGAPTTFTSPLQVTGAGDLTITGATATKVGGGPWAAPSDRRVKKNTASYTAGLDVVRALSPITFQYNGLGGIAADGRTYHGLFADEVLPVMPEMVTTHLAKLDPEDDTETELYQLNTAPLVFALINAIKELTTRIETLEAPA